MGPAAAVAILHARGPDSVLLIRRAERRGDPWSGHWSLPGGRCDAADAGPLDTALREMEEECGLRLDRERMRHARPEALARRRSGPVLTVAPFVFEVEQELPAVPDGREAVSTLWLPVAALRDPERHRLGEAPGVPRERRYPGIDLPGVPLWGFTYHLLSDWLGLTAEGAGQRAASRALEFLLSRGLTLQRSWDGERTALVRGAIPVEEMIREFTVPGCDLPGLNCVEVLPESVTVVDAQFVEWTIRPA